MALKDICSGNLFKDERNESQENRKKMASRERSVWWIWNCKECSFCFPRQSRHLKNLTLWKGVLPEYHSLVYQVHIPLMQVGCLKVTTDNSVLLQNRNLYFNAEEISTIQQYRFFWTSKKISIKKRRALLDCLTS